MFCRFCGKELRDDSIYCSYCGKRLDGDGTSRVDDSFGELGGFFGDIAHKNPSEDAEHRATLDKARAFIVMGRTQSALELYDQMVENSPADAAGYIGYIRVASGNFLSFNGKIYHTKMREYIGVRDYVNKVTVLLNGKPSGDAEYDAFLQRMRACDEAEKRRRKEAEAAERKRREEEEARKLREAEEAERRKPIELKEALKKGLELYEDKKFQEAYSCFETVLRLSNELQKALPLDFRFYFEELCRRFPQNARQCEPAMEYFRRLSDKDDCDAQYTLGCIYYNGKTERVWGSGYCYKHPEEQLANEMFKKAIDNGSADAMIRMGDSHFQMANDKKASYIDYDYESETYSDRNKKEIRECYLQAIYWYQKASDIGSVNADNKLANCYRFGLGFEMDIERAIAIYKKTNSYEILGDIYAGHPKNDLTTAIMYYKYVDKFFKIAALYEKLGRKSDAIEYYRKCVAEGNYNATEAEKRIAILMYG